MSNILTFGIFVAIGILFVNFPYSIEQDEDIPHHEVKNWALKFGVDLWEFGRQFTKMNEIQRKYHDMDVEVARKDGLILIREMAAEVKNMMDIKMNAVLRIMDSAEQAALSHKFEPALSSKYVHSRRISSYNTDARSGDGAREVPLMPNRHFDHLPVNTNVSSILIPSNIEETDSDVQNAIKWSEILDPLFVNNYEYDPSLSWQYFGSSSGFLRRYPAIKWPPVEGMPDKSNVYDFRTSSWYIDAATSPKDIVILLDTSGSMTGHRKDIARAIIFAVLETLGNNDFVNVFRFAEQTDSVVPCFKDALVQATDGNLRELRNAVDSVKGEGIANFTSALVTGFEILHRYNRTGQGCQCNQAIMLVTDGPPSSFQDIFKKYNWPHMPVRMFTYLTGKDGSNADDMNWMACNNKGYYARVTSVSDAKEKVLQYIAVLARPMVLYQHDHPVAWTPVYAGGKANSLQGSALGDEQLMTSISTPIFDRRNYSERTAKLLGIVGTDVPIHHIKKLIPPYKIGPNGYAFIVDNNGHVLFHPDLRPLLRKGEFQETLKPNYNSVDLTEVELVNSEGGTPQENNSLLLDLRHEMIDQKEGETELNVIIHFDDLKRVLTRRHRYFYNAIDGTPFSLGIALPEGYGMYEVLNQKEIKHMPMEVTEYFKGSNWSVHPDWVYCEYNYPSEHWFESAEEQLLHFLARTRKPGWKWMSLRPRSPVKESGHNAMKKMEKDSYFCDKFLTQALVYDAMATEGMDRPSSPALLKEEQSQGYEMFGVALSFIATRSGLLRWQNHGNYSPDPTLPPFSETNRRALDEVWYKRAVHQHTIDPESFVFSVPFDAATQHRPLVTASHAVFVENKGHRAPAAVVGIQFIHATLASHFINITSVCTGGVSCRRNCASPELDCYILDNNGFIIISESSDHTGKFFGEIDGTIMDSLVKDSIYSKVAVYDYQGACVDDKSHYSDSAHPSHVSPLRPIQWFVDFLINNILWLAVHFELQQLWNQNWVSAQYDGDEDYVDYETDNANFENGATDELGSDVKEDYSEPIIESGNGGSTEVVYQSNTNSPPAAKYTPSNKTQPRPCTKRVHLYNLQPDRLNTGGLFNPLKAKLTNCHSSGCERPFSVQKIPHSNLILLVVDTLCPCGSNKFKITAEEMSSSSGSTPPCSRKPQESMYRRRPPKCISYHPEEIEIRACGRAYDLTMSTILLGSCMTFAVARVFHELT